MIMKTNESIQKNIRDYVQQTICNSLYADRKTTLKWIMERFEGHEKSLSLEHLIELSADYSSLLATNPYNYDTKRIYKDIGLSEVMSYTQFIFELPRIWYTTLYRLICEWNEEFNEGVDTAY
jgi:hypothetical protein